MSIKATNWVYQQVKVGRKLKPTLLALADVADDDGIAFPSLETIRVKIEAAATKTVARHIKKLLELGVIERARRKAGYRNTTNVYRLKLEGKFDCSEAAVMPSSPAPGSDPSTDKMSLLNDSSRDTQESLLSGDKMSLLNSRVGTELCPPSRDTAVSPELSRTDNSLNKNNNTAPAADPFKPSPVTDATIVEMHSGWMPSETAIQLIVRQGPSRDFVLDAVPEFILYWIEARDQKRSMGTWNQRFSGHCKRQWVRYESLLAGGIPRPLTPDFFPSEETISNLVSRGLPREFILGEIDSFRRYWVESGVPMPAWNSKFHSQTLRRWIERPRGDVTMQDKLNDRSWADDGGQHAAE
jgi:hypothetical protein